MRTGRAAKEQTLTWEKGEMMMTTRKTTKVMKVRSDVMWCGVVWCGVVWCSDKMAR